MKTDGGFTLIELVVVIIILGILAAVAVPKFVDMSFAAHAAAAKGVAAALSSGSAMNVAAKAVNAASAITINAANACTATILSPLLTASGVALVNGGPSNDNEFYIGTYSGSTDCSGTNAYVWCGVTPNGIGVLAVPVTIFCAR